VHVLPEYWASIQHLGLFADMLASLWEGIGSCKSVEEALGVITML
jgi:hypothetical protein